ncbi:MAG: aspartate aminotransferase, partial [Proteobacteria bacterium]|nr:aspartate aminotransferase [Pseudomonadota bacterium]
MPRYQMINSHISQMSKGVFTKFAAALREMKGEIYPLHIGDTYIEPLAQARVESIRSDSKNGVHRYTFPQGHPDLLQALSEYHHHPLEQTIVSAGATAGISAVATATLSPGDEVLILAPYWPLVAGIVKIMRCKPICVPFFDHIQDPDQISAHLKRYTSERTVAVYVNSPNNPTGKILPEAFVQEIAQFARREDLWIWSDEVYDRLTYTRPSVRIADYAPDRTIEFHSFSKLYGMAGNRCGYVLLPSSELMFGVRKAITHSFYSTPTVSQLAALRALQEGEEWLSNACAAYKKAGEDMADALGVKRPDGSTFLFINVASLLDQDGVDG